MRRDGRRRASVQGIGSQTEQRRMSAPSPYEHSFPQSHDGIPRRRRVPHIRRSRFAGGIETETMKQVISGRDERKQKRQEGRKRQKLSFCCSCPSCPFCFRSSTSSKHLLR